MNKSLLIVLCLLGFFGCDIQNDEKSPEEGAARDVSGTWVVSGNGRFIECKNSELNGVDFSFSDSNLAWQVTHASKAAPMTGGVSTDNESMLVIEIPGASSAEVRGIVKGSSVRLEYSDTLEGLGKDGTKAGLLSLIFTGVVTDFGDIQGDFVHSTNSDCQAEGTFSIEITSSAPTAGGISAQQDNDSGGTAMTGGSASVPVGGKPSSGGNQGSGGGARSDIGGNIDAPSGAGKAIPGN